MLFTFSEYSWFSDLYALVKVFFWAYAIFSLVWGLVARKQKTIEYGLIAFISALALSSHEAFFISRIHPHNPLCDSSTDQQKASLQALLAHVPKNFLWGVATSEYQLSGAASCPQSQWNFFEQKHPALVPSGKSADHWNRFLEDVDLLTELGVNAYRFSVEWSCIEPQAGVYDEQALSHYKHLCEKLVERGIEPMVTLHHFTHPQWFEDKGAFEYAENIHYFIRFCTRLSAELGDYVHLWCTFNEPGIYVFMGYILGLYPPGRVLLERGGAVRAGQVLKNMLEAHKEVYKAIKRTSQKKQVSVGIAHNITQVEPYRATSLLDQVGAYYFNYLMHGSITNFLITKKFTFSLPWGKETYYEDSEWQIDFIGLNYYSRVLFDITKGAVYNPAEVPTDMPYGIYPKGFYKALKQIAQVGVPIYITENGIADAHDDRRACFIKQYLDVLGQALQENIDIRGYFYWSLLDNFEWHFGYAQKFGLYQVDFETQRRSLRPGARYFQELLHMRHQ